MTWGVKIRVIIPKTLVTIHFRTDEMKIEDPKLKN